MFWDAVAGGFKMFSHWETYVAGVVFASLYALSNFLSGLLIANRPRLGLVNMFVVTPFLTALIPLIFVLTMFPILLGLGNEAAWTAPWWLFANETWSMMKAGFILMIASVLLAIIPILGRIVTLHSLVLGGISLMFALSVLRNIRPDLPINQIKILPGFWEIVGFVIVSATASWIGMMVTAGLVSIAMSAAADKGKVDDPESATQLLAMLILPIFGLIPVFIYAAWLGLQIHR